MQDARSYRSCTSSSVSGGPKTYHGLPAAVVIGDLRGVESDEGLSDITIPDWLRTSH